MKYCVLIVLLLLLWSAKYSSCQEVNRIECVQNVKYKYLKKDLPKDVCLNSAELEVKYIFPKTDINNDGFDDCVVKYGNIDLKDGDTLYVAIYFQDSKGKYSLFKTLDNLYPIYLNKYGRSYKPDNADLEELMESYLFEYPLFKLEFEKSKILIELKNDAESNLIMVYEFDNEKENWLLKNKKEFFFNIKEYLTINISEEINQPIEKFSYLN